MKKYLTEKNLLWAILAVLTVVSVLQAKHICESVTAPLPLKGK